MITNPEERVLAIGALVKENLGTSADLDLVVRELKRNGLSKIESMFVLARLFNMTLQDAKPFVHLSTHWSEEKENDEKFVDQLHEEALKLSKDDGQN